MIASVRGCSLFLIALQNRGKGFSDVKNKMAHINYRQESKRSLSQDPPRDCANPPVKKKPSGPRSEANLVDVIRKSEKFIPENFLSRKKKRASDISFAAFIEMRMDSSRYCSTQGACSARITKLGKSERGGEMRLEVPTSRHAWNRTRVIVIIRASALSRLAKSLECRTAIAAAHGWRGV